MLLQLLRGTWIQRFLNEKCFRRGTITNRSELYEFCMVVPTTQNNGHYRSTNKFNRAGDMFKSVRHLPLRKMQSPSLKSSAMVSNRIPLIPSWKRKTARLKHYENPSNRLRCKKLKTKDLGGPNDGIFRRMKGKVTIYCFLHCLF